MKKKPTIWLARDKISTSYLLSIGVEITRDGGNWHAWHPVSSMEVGILIPSRDFHRIAPKSCHLKPGEGPIKITVSIKRAK